jgi:hypothetical protein
VLKNALLFIWRLIDFGRITVWLLALFLLFKLKFANGTGAMSIMPAGCIDSIFRRLDVYHGSNVLKQIDQYGNLCNVLLDSQVHPVDRAYQWNVAKGTSSTIGTRTGTALSLAAAGNTSQYYNIIIRSWW